MISELMRIMWWHYVWIYFLKVEVVSDEILGKKRYASQNSAIDNMYIKEINKLKSNEADYDRLSEKLEKRLDGVE